MDGRNNLNGSLPLSVAFEAKIPFLLQVEKTDTFVVNKERWRGYLSISICLLFFAIDIEDGGNEVLTRSLGRLTSGALLITTLTTCVGVRTLLLWRYIRFKGGDTMCDRNVYCKLTFVRFAESDATCPKAWRCCDNV